MNSASLCSLAGRYNNNIPSRFLAPIDCLKIPAQLYVCVCHAPVNVENLCKLVLAGSRPFARPLPATPTDCLVLQKYLTIKGTVCGEQIHYFYKRINMEHDLRKM
jgi:hypothetical protein